MILGRAVCLASALLCPSPAEEVRQQTQPSPERRPVFLVLEDEPAVDHPESFWIGYPSKKWQGLEKSVEEHVLKVRAENKLGEVESLEELRFIARAHCRENVATKNSEGHLSRHFGYVSDRAATLYGWGPTEWKLPNEEFTDGYRIADNGGATPTMTPEGWVEKGWMTSPGHRAAILNPPTKFIGMGLGGDGNFTPGHLIFASIPKATYEKIQSLQPLYAQLANAKKVPEIKSLIQSIVEKAEGSSFIRLAPLLRDSQKEVRFAAIEGLRKLNEAVPQAKGSVFALVEWGVASPFAETALESAKTLKALTGQSHKTARAWADWWKSSWKKYAGPKQK